MGARNDDSNDPYYQECGGSFYDIDCSLSQCYITGSDNCTSMTYSCNYANCTTQNPKFGIIMIVASLNNPQSWPLDFLITDSDLST